MKQFFLVISLMLSLSIPLHAQQADEQKRILIITASYNNEPWYQRNLDSVFAQQYDNYHLIYIDDCSTDNTFELVVNYVKQSDCAHKVTLIKNNERKGAMSNQYHAIHTYAQPGDIVVILDGDDRFVPNEEVPHVDGAGVLAYVNQMYQDPTVWITYGQFRVYPTGAHGWACAYPSSIVERNAFRDYPHGPSHLRTFYADLFFKIDPQDLMDGQENFVPASADLAAMLPMMEMAQQGHFRFVPDVLLEYNDVNPLNEYRVSKQRERTMDLMIRARPRYEPLETLF